MPEPTLPLPIPIPIPMPIAVPWAAAIVDLDGTLVDTMGDFVAALNAMLSDMALPTLPRSAVERLVGKGSEYLVNSAIALVGAQLFAIKTEAFRIQTHTKDALASYQQHYQRINGAHASVYPGAVAGLQRLQNAGIRLACVTNKPTAFAVDLLKAKSLLGYFESIFGGDAFERKKPDPMPLLKTCAALGTSPSTTLMIGDSSNDAQAARSAGCPVVLVTYGYNHGRPIRQVPADGFVDSLTDVPLSAQLLAEPSTASGDVRS